jgi:multidrug efflux pump subunit AcrA (membrane-fusion protein)
MSLTGKVATNAQIRLDSDTLRIVTVWCVHSYGLTPKQLLEEFESQGNIDRTFARLAAEAPAVKQAEAKLEAANRDLALAELDLRYCDIVAEIDGVVTRRNVNPGNDVQVGQSLMAIRSLTRSGSMAISRRRSCATCASAKRSICMSTCTATDRYSMVGSPALPWGLVRHSRRYRRRMPRATLSRSSSAI